MQGEGLKRGSSVFSVHYGSHSDTKNGLLVFPLSARGWWVDQLAIRHVNAELWKSSEVAVVSHIVTSTHHITSTFINTPN